MLTLFTTAVLTLGALARPGAAVVPDTAGQAATWRIDATHSELLFRVRHIVSRVTGTFTDWEGTLTADAANWNAGTVSVTVRTASISTNNQRRDTHLRSADFFDVEKFPTMTFKSTKVNFGAELPSSVEGNLTLLGVTKPVTLTVTSFHCMPHPMLKKDACGANATTKIKRSEFNAGKNAPYVSDEVTLTIPVEAVKG